MREDSSGNVWKGFPDSKQACKVTKVEVANAVSELSPYTSMTKKSEDMRRAYGCFSSGWKPREARHKEVGLLRGLGTLEHPARGRQHVSVSQHETASWRPVGSGKVQVSGPSYMTEGAEPRWR